MRHALFLAALFFVVGCLPGTKRGAADAKPAPVATGGAVVTDASASKPLQLAAPMVSDGAVKLETIPQYDAFFSGAAGAPLNVLVRLTGVGDVPKARPALDLAVVIDRSGSMSGQKIRSVKEAAMRLLSKLGPNDRVTLISYSDSVRIHTEGLPVDDTGRERLRGALLMMHAQGGTALGPAVMRALSLLSQDRGDGERMAHVLLLSDGLANEGEQRPEVLGQHAATAFRRGVSLSTLGVGTDYNEDLMTKLADQGGGRYHFIKDGPAIAGVLDDELKGLVATVARGVELAVTGSAGVRVVRVFGYPVLDEDNTTTIRVGALGAKQVREILLRLHVPAGIDPQIAVASLALSYKDVVADGAAKRMTQPLSVYRALDAAAMRKTEHAEVTVRVAEVESAEQMEQAARAADRGDFAQASSTLSIAIDALEAEESARPSAKLKKQISSLKEAKSEVGAASGSAKARKVFTKKYKARAYKSKK